MIANLPCLKILPSPPKWFKISAHYFHIKGFLVMNLASKTCSLLKEKCDFFSITLSLSLPVEMEKSCRWNKTKCLLKDHSFVARTRLASVSSSKINKKTWSPASLVLKSIGALQSGLKVLPTASTLRASLSWILLLKHARCWKRSVIFLV